MAIAINNGLKEALYNEENILTNHQHNDIVVLMIPELVNIGASVKVLPLRIHEATLTEVEERFATNEKRKHLFRGLVKACKSLKTAGCSTIYLDGSYVTEREFPSDYDVCWSPYNVDVGKLDPVILDFSDDRKKQKSKYGGEFFPLNAKADASHLFIQYFQKDKETGLEKGIIRIKL